MAGPHAPRSMKIFQHGRICWQPGAQLRPFPVGRGVRVKAFGRFWPEADLQRCPSCVRFRGIPDVAFRVRHGSL